MTGSMLCPWAIVVSSPALVLGTQLLLEGSGESCGASGVSQSQSEQCLLASHRRGTRVSGTRGRAFGCLIVLVNHFIRTNKMYEFCRQTVSLRGMDMTIRITYN